MKQRHLLPVMALFLISVASVAGDHTQTQIKRSSINLHDLLSFYMIPVASSHNTLAWATATSSAVPVQWQDSDLWQDKISHEFRRSGNVRITMNNKTDPWRILLTGSHNGIRAVSLGIEQTVDLEKELSNRKVSLKLYKCYAGISLKERMYRITVPNKKPAWLVWSWSCGNRMCSSDIELFLYRKDADRDRNADLETECGSLPIMK